MAKKISTAASACAPFCTAEDVEQLKDNEAFALARRVRAALGNIHYILPLRPCDVKPGYWKHAPIYLGTEYGIPHLSVRCSAMEYSVTEQMPPRFFSGNSLVDSSNASYVLTRAKKKLKTRSFASFRTDIHKDFRELVFNCMKEWLVAASAQENVSVGSTVLVSPLTQEYLLRYFTDNITDKALIPSSTLYEINTAAETIYRSRSFTNKTLDLAKSMFAREKWIAMDMGSHVLLAGVDTTSLCQVAQEITSSKKDPKSVYHYQYNFDLRFTHGPTVYRSLDAMPDEVRTSLMSSLAFAKTMLLQDPRLASLGESDAFFRLPFNGAKPDVSSPDAGWVFKNAHEKSYAQTILMDKD